MSFKNISFSTPVRFAFLFLKWNIFHFVCFKWLLDKGRGAYGPPRCECRILTNSWTPSGRVPNFELNYQQGVGLKPYFPGAPNLQNTWAQPTSSRATEQALRWSELRPDSVTLAGAPAGYRTVAGGMAYYDHPDDCFKVLTGRPPAPQWVSQNPIWGTSHPNNPWGSWSVELCLWWLHRLPMWPCEYVKVKKFDKARHRAIYVLKTSIYLPSP